MPILHLCPANRQIITELAYNVAAANDLEARTVFSRKGYSKQKVSIKNKIRTVVRIPIWAQKSRPKK